MPLVLSHVVLVLALVLLETHCTRRRERHAEKNDVAKMTWQQRQKATVSSAPSFPARALLRLTAAVSCAVFQSLLCGRRDHHLADTSQAGPRRAGWRRGHLSQCQSRVRGRRNAPGEQRAVAVCRCCHVIFATSSSVLITLQSLCNRSLDRKHRRAAPASASHAQRYRPSVSVTVAGKRLRP